MAGLRRWLTVAARAAISLLLVGLPGSAALADQVRDSQWPLAAFNASSRVWPLSTGKGVVVAVIDSGVRAIHVDLVGQVIPGRNFSYGGDGRKDYSSVGHGTAMASLIAGHGHGEGAADGVIGLAPKAKIIPLTIGLGSTSDEYSEMAAAIHYAVDQGSTVVNLSEAGSFDARVQSAVAYAEAHDVVLVAGAGNDGLQADNYPAAYPGVVSVAAADQSGKVWPMSDYGPSLVLTAPGVHIVAAGANSDTEYRLSDGTSDATAYVSAAAALLRAKFPSLTAGQIINRLVQTAVNPTAPPGNHSVVRDPHYGYGIIRPDLALSQTIPAGPASGPLPQLGQAATTGQSGQPAAAAASVPARDRQTAASSAPTSTSSMLLGISAGCIAVLAAATATLLLLRRHRHRRQPPSSH